MNKQIFSKKGIALLVLLTLFSVKLAAKDMITFTCQVIKYSVGFNIKATYDKAFEVNWGDGTTETIIVKRDFRGESVLHKYAKDGEYHVIISALDLECRFYSFEVDNNSPGLIDLNISCSALKELRCRRQQLLYLDLRGCSALEFLECDNNKILMFRTSF